MRCVSHVGISPWLYDAVRLSAVSGVFAYVQ